MTQRLHKKTCCTAKVLSISSKGSSGHTHHSYKWLQKNTTTISQKALSVPLFLTVT